MKKYSLTHLADESVARGLDRCDTTDRSNLAELLAHLAEYDERGLYRPAGYSSMHDYCMEKLGWWEQAALKRVRASRTARKYPAIFDMVADGRLHLSAIVLLTPHLTAENASELLAAASKKTKLEIERLLAHRFPRPDVPALIRAIPVVLPPPTMPQLSPGTVGEVKRPNFRPDECSEPALEPWPKMTPLAPQRFGIQFTIGESAHAKFREAQELLSHQISPKDYEKLFERLLDLALPELRKRKFGATSKPRALRAHAPANARHIPAHVKRAVWGRDGGQCTFVSDNGHRCSARERLEYDHVIEAARGGTASVSNIRLRCRAHNQYAAERAFGPGFMRLKRENARRAAAEAVAQVTAAVERAQATRATREWQGLAADSDRRGLAAGP